MRAFIFLILSGLFFLMGCESSQESSSELPAKIADIEPVSTNSKESKPVSFTTFLDHFIDDDAMDDWPEAAQDPLVLNGAIYNAAEIELTLSVTFTEIPAEYNGLIPVEKLKKLAEGVPETKTPRQAFQFYGFRKVKSEKYWLLSFFARKLRRNENNEYHGHPFLLATFTPTGDLIDDYVWWTIEDDDLQAWDYVDVDGEILQVGQKADMNDDILSKVQHKVKIAKDGKFKVLK